MMTLIHWKDGEMKTGTSISIAAAVMFAIAMLRWLAQGGRQ